MSLTLQEVDFCLGGDAQGEEVRDSVCSVGEPVCLVGPCGEHNLRR